MIPEYLTDKFTNDAIPPFDAPQEVLAWIQLPTGNVYLRSDWQWVDPQDEIRGSILNRSMRYLSPGPAQGPLFEYHLMFISVFYGHRYPVFARTRKPDDFSEEPVIH